MTGFHTALRFDFLALALTRADDYRRAGIPMMPNVKGADRTRAEILAYSVVLVVLGVLPYTLGFASLLYLALAITLGGMFLFFAGRVFRVRGGAKAERCARQLFGFSILYLFLLFADLVCERSLALVIGWV